MKQQNSPPPLIRDSHPASRFTADTANSFWSANDWNGLRNFADQWKAASPNDYRPFFYGGIAHRSLKNFAESESHLKNAIRLNPKGSDLWENLANVLLDRNQSESALSHYKKAIELSPDDPCRWESLGRALLSLKRLPQAESIARKAVSQSFLNGTASMLLAEVLAKKANMLISEDNLEVAWVTIEDLKRLAPASADSLLAHPEIKSFAIEQQRLVTKGATSRRSRVRQKGDQIRIGRTFAVSFRRTLRVPEDGKAYPLPPDCGSFPICRVEDYADKVPKKWLDEGGYFIPMHQREALWLNLPVAKWRPCVAKIGVGRVNAVTGSPWDNKLRKHKQDYVVCPDQLWLDGINAGNGFVKQFVAMPLGLGYTIEWQVTDEEEFGGIQILAFEPKTGLFAEEDPNSVAVKLSPEQVLKGIQDVQVPGMESMTAQFMPARPVLYSPDVGEKEMGLAAGGRIRQQIFEDKYGPDCWDDSVFGVAHIRVINTEMYQRITGQAAPATPISARTYAEKGLPWFDYYDERKAAVLPARVLATIKSIGQIDRAKGLRGQQDDESVTINPKGIRKVVRSPEELIESALANQAAGNYKAAMEDASMVLSTEPNSGCALSVRASARCETEDYGLALIDALQALKHLPKNPTALAVRDRCLNALASRTDFKPLFRVESDSEALKAIAVALSGLPFEERSAKILDQATSAIERQAEALPLAEPEITIRPGLGISKHVAEALDRKTLSLNKAGRLKASIRLAKVLCELVPQFPRGFFLSAVSYFELKEFKRARKMQLMGPEVQWQSTVAPHMMACIEVALGNHLEAVKYAKHAIRIKPAIKKELLQDRDLEPIWPKLRWSFGIFN